MIKIGWLVYKNGEIFLLNLFDGNIDLVRSINMILLIGYYLTNIGYAIITIAYWGHVSSLGEMVGSLSKTLGKIILLLAVLHYNNIFWLKQIEKSKLLK
ncbi:hypothetical protein [Winogradskyella sp.]|uniref:hypothetical protein n=1 Tax=Winogradskyella sp. TaxID=1883156 RepID=UPI00260BD5D0|nr:hypothetical protein [Winogradskyella sp.]